MTKLSFPYWISIYWIYFILLRSINQCSSELLCNELVGPANGNYYGSDGEICVNKSRPSICYLECDKGYELKHSDKYETFRLKISPLANKFSFNSQIFIANYQRCDNYGNWHGPQMSCAIRSCQLEMDESFVIECNTIPLENDKYVYGTICYYRCKNFRREIISGRIYRECTAYGIWSVGSPLCVDIDSINRPNSYFVNKSYFNELFPTTTTSITTSIITSITSMTIKEKISTSKLPPLTTVISLPTSIMKSGKKNNIDSTTIITPNNNRKNGNNRCPNQKENSTKEINQQRTLVTLRELFPELNNRTIRTDMRKLLSKIVNSLSIIHKSVKSVLSINRSFYNRIVKFIRENISYFMGNNSITNITTKTTSTTTTTNSIMITNIINKKFSHPFIKTITTTTTRASIEIGRIFESEKKETVKINYENNSFYKLNEQMALSNMSIKHFDLNHIRENVTSDENEEIVTQTRKIIEPLNDLVIIEQNITNNETMTTTTTTTTKRRRAKVKANKDNLNNENILSTSSSLILYNSSVSALNETTTKIFTRPTNITSSTRPTIVDNEKIINKLHPPHHLNISPIKNENRIYLVENDAKVSFIVAEYNMKNQISFHSPNNSFVAPTIERKRYRREVKNPRIRKFLFLFKYFMKKDKIGKRFKNQIKSFRSAISILLHHKVIGKRFKKFMKKLGQVDLLKQLFPLLFKSKSKIPSTFPTTTNPFSSTVSPVHRTSEEEALTHKLTRSPTTTTTRKMKFIEMKRNVEVVSSENSLKEFSDPNSHIGKDKSTPKTNMETTSLSPVTSLLTYLNGRTSERDDSDSDRIADVNNSSTHQINELFPDNKMRIVDKKVSISHNSTSIIKDGSERKETSNQEYSGKVSRLIDTKIRHTLQMNRTITFRYSFDFNHLQRLILYKNSSYGRSRLIFWTFDLIESLQTKFICLNNFNKFNHFTSKFLYEFNDERFCPEIDDGKRLIIQSTQNHLIEFGIENGRMFVRLWKEGYYRLHLSIEQFFQQYSHVKIDEHNLFDLIDVDLWFFFTINYLPTNKIEINVNSKSLFRLNTSIHSTRQQFFDRLQRSFKYHYFYRTIHQLYLIRYKLYRRLNLYEFFKKSMANFKKEMSNNNLSKRNSFEHNRNNSDKDFQIKNSNKILERIYFPSSIYYSRQYNDSNKRNEQLEMYYNNLRHLDIRKIMNMTDSFLTYHLTVYGRSFDYEKNDRSKLNDKKLTNNDKNHHKEFTQIDNDNAKDTYTSHLYYEKLLNNHLERIRDNSMIKSVKDYILNRMGFNEIFRYFYSNNYLSRLLNNKTYYWDDKYYGNENMIKEKRTDSTRITDVNAWSKYMEEEKMLFNLMFNCRISNEDQKRMMTFNWNNDSSHPATTSKWVKQTISDVIDIPNYIDERKCSLQFTCQLDHLTHYLKLEGRWWNVIRYGSIPLVRIYCQSAKTLKLSNPKQYFYEIQNYLSLMQERYGEIGSYGKNGTSTNSFNKFTYENLTSVKLSYVIGICLPIGTWFIPSFQCI